jgi:DNA-binding IclR family transcriptional regulator
MCLSYLGDVVRDVPSSRTLRTSATVVAGIHLSQYAERWFNMLNDSRLWKATMTTVDQAGQPQAGPSAAGQPGAGTGSARAVVPALDRGMRILRLLAASPQRAYSLAEITQRLGVPKSTAFNICGALTQGQLLRRSRDGFQLGRGLLELGSAYASSVNLVAEFYEACRETPPDLGAVIQLAVLDEDLQAVYLAHQDCGSGLDLGLGGIAGRRVPANCTAGGKILLALLPPAELDERLRQRDPLPRITRRSITSRARLAREIAAARETGHAFDEDGAIIGLSCVATGFSSSRADGGHLAVSITAQTDALDGTRRKLIRVVLDEVAGKLRARVLGPGRPDQQKVAQGHDSTGGLPGVTLEMAAAPARTELSSGPRRRWH